MQIKILSIAFLIACFIAGCSNNREKPGQQSSAKLDSLPVKPLIISGDDDGGMDGDIRLSMVETSESEISTNYKAVSSYQNERVGVMISVPKIKNDKDGFGRGIILKSLGKESDNLLFALTKIYKLQIDHGARFIDSTVVDYVDLYAFASSVAKGATNPKTDAMEYKLFFVSKKDEAEIFLNINPKDKWIEFREKDPEYRQSIIKFLTK